MLDTHTALAAAARPPARSGSTPRRVLVAGGGGTLGSAVLERLLAEHRFARVGVLAEATLNPALRRLQPVADEPAAFAAFAPDTALVVYDRERLANGREAALLRPQPADLLALATRLHDAGVQTLVVVVPHSAALLPAALSQGLASLDEGAVAALGFARLVFMRTAQAGRDGGSPARWPERLAAWMLSQLHWMVPARQQPVRAATVARVAVDLALQLPAAEPGTRVLAPEWLWHAAQTGDAPALARLLGGWLAGQAPPVAQGGAGQRW